MGRDGILRLAEPRTGQLAVDTVQRRVRCRIRSIGLEPRTWAAGGLGKRIEAYRLPERMASREFGFALPLGSLRKGDNPIHVRVRQVDGHMAWSSPVYVLP